jgi:hypothetical protein
MTGRAAVPSTLDVLDRTSCPFAGGTSPLASRFQRMPRILITCPSGRGAVPTGYRTQDIDLAACSHERAFRCVCGVIHTWNTESAWAEEGLTPAALRAYGLGAPPRPPAALGERVG